MGCFFGCFRIRDDHHTNRPPPHLVSHSSKHPKEAAVVSQNRLSSLFLSQEGVDDSPRKEKGLESLETETITKELKDEAKFLKACGTLPETPAEIRKANEKTKHSPPHSGDINTPKFHSWLPNMSTEKLRLVNQFDLPLTPVKLCEEWAKGSDSSELTPISCITIGRNSTCSTDESGIGGSTSSSKIHIDQSVKGPTSVSPRDSAITTQHRNKSVHFNCDSQVYTLSSSSSLYANISQNQKKSEFAGNDSVSKSSPYPTPLKLSDQMQTPGTVFPVNVEDIENGKIARIRSQYVYSVMNPVENSSQWRALKEEESNLYQISCDLRDSLEQPVNASPSQESRKKETSLDKDLKVEASLSSWLKPAPSNRDTFTISIGETFNGNHGLGRSPGDRPIVGSVAAYWNEQEPTQISPKWWDGNGIPNSTNKYKEDQKVSWHATPFEERLEKALSEESFISQRKNISKAPMAFDDNEENDTAGSHLHSLPLPKSVESF